MTHAIEERRLDIEQRKLDVEIARLNIEQVRAHSLERFFVRHLGEVIAAAIAFAGVAVSAANVWNGSVQKKHELEQAANQAKLELMQQRIVEDGRLAVQKEDNLQRDRASERDHSYKWKLDMMQFVERHNAEIFSNDSARIKRVQQLMLAAFPPAEVMELFLRLEASSPSDEAKQSWRAGGGIATTVSSALTASRLRVSPNIPEGLLPALKGPYCYRSRNNGEISTDFGELTVYCAETLDACMKEAPDELKGQTALCKKVLGLSCWVAWDTPGGPGQTRPFFDHCFEQNSACERDRANYAGAVLSGKNAFRTAISDRCYRFTP
jgi:hypothetical protein